MRSWTVYAPEFPAAVNEEDSREKMSPIQVLLVGNFYVNAVSEDRAAQVNEGHGTAIKAGQGLQIQQSKDGETPVLIPCAQSFSSTQFFS